MKIVAHFGNLRTACKLHWRGREASFSYRKIRHETKRYLLSNASLAIGAGVGSADIGGIRRRRDRDTGGDRRARGNEALDLRVM